MHDCVIIHAVQYLCVISVWVMLCSCRCSIRRFTSLRGPVAKCKADTNQLKKKKECHKSMFYEIPLYPDSPETSQPRVIQAPTSYSKPSKSTSSQHLMGWLNSTASPHMFSICKVVHLLIKNMKAGFYFSDM